MKFNELFFILKASNRRKKWPLQLFQFRSLAPTVATDILSDINSATVFGKIEIKSERETESGHGNRQDYLR